MNSALFHHFQGCFGTPHVVDVTDDLERRHGMIGEQRDIIRVHVLRSRPFCMCLLLSVTSLECVASKVASPLSVALRPYQFHSCIGQNGKRWGLLKSYLQHCMHNFAKDGVFMSQQPHSEHSHRHPHPRMHPHLSQPDASDSLAPAVGAFWGMTLTKVIVMMQPLMPIERCLGQTRRVHLEQPIIEMGDIDTQWERCLSILWKSRPRRKWMSLSGGILHDALLPTVSASERDAEFGTSSISTTSNSLLQLLTANAAAHHSSCHSTCHSAVSELGKVAWTATRRGHNYRIDCSLREAIDPFSKWFASSRFSFKVSTALLEKSGQRGQKVAGVWMLSR
ncbi:hypothetical protein TcWFU_004708 [Taenia crassiceps]|uniref:Uncharacterized protein n=1 Tax=Taenia crassiceps TaxID=6207 RepID=A0ABR4Q750_9CEST